jgi:hypothetical protein
MSMREFGPQLGWLADPGLVPEDAVEVGGSDDSLEKRCGSLAMWMVEELGTATGEVHEKINVGEVFEKHALSLKERVDLTLKFTKYPKVPYLPGLLAMGAIYAAVPALAAREGRQRSEWPEIGLRAQGFGQAISVHGTDAQAAILGFLSNEWVSETRSLNLGRLRLDDDMGITTVTPFEDVLGTAIEVARASGPIGLGEHTCIAHQVDAPDEETGSFFGGVWRSYGAAADRLAYRGIDIDESQVPPEEEPVDRAEIYAQMEQELKKDFELLKKTRD